MRTRSLLYGIPVILLLGVLTARRLRPVPVEGQEVSTGEVVSEVLGIGGLESARQVAVAFEVSGRVTALAVAEGETVAEGALLGTLDVSDAERDLAVTRANERAAAAAVERAQAELQRGRIAAERAASERARADALFTGGAMHASDLEAAIERDDGAQADLVRLSSALAQAERTLEAARHSSEVRAAQVNDGQLVSPVGGLVVTRRVEVGQLVTPGTPAFDIVDPASLQVEAWVDETALASLEAGQPARIEFRSEAGRSLPGRVARISREVDRQTHELIVEIAVLEAPRGFALGQRADAWIAVDRRDDVPRVPRGWCAQTCLVVEDGRASARAVTLGLQGREWTEITAGLAPGEQVLAPGSVREGRRVRVEETP